MDPTPTVVLIKLLATCLLYYVFSFVPTLLSICFLVCFTDLFKYFALFKHGSLLLSNQVNVPLQSDREQTDCQH